MKSQLICTRLILKFFVALSIANAFPQGKERSYTLVSDVTVKDFEKSPKIDYRVRGTVRVGSIWTLDSFSLLKFKLIKPTLQISSTKGDDYFDHRSPLDTAINEIFFALWHKGHITKVYLSENEEQPLINLKKSIISLFQYQLLEGSYIENDITGKCEVVYEFQSNEMYKKKKLVCYMNDLIGNSRSDTVMGIVTVLNRTAEYKVTYDGILDKIESHESYHIFVAANTNAGHIMESRMFLKFDGELNEIPTVQTKTVDETIGILAHLHEHVLISTFSKKCIGIACSSLKNVIKELKNEFAHEKVGTSSVALTLAKTILSARKASKEDFLKIFNAFTMQDIKGKLLDILAATQTIESHEAAISVLKITSDNDLLNVERYLQSLSVGSRPQEKVIVNLLEFAKKDLKCSKIKDTLLQTIASMSYRYTKLTSSNGYDSSVVQNVSTHLKLSLEKCLDASCSEVYIRSMQNLGSPETVDLLIGHVYNKQTKISVAAMRALQIYAINIWNHRRKNTIQDVFYQKSQMFDSSARIIALDILLNLHPTENEIEELLYFLQVNDKAYEVKQYLIQKIQLLSVNCAKFKEIVRKILVTNPRLNAYIILGQKGLSTVMSRPYTRQPSFNGTLLSVQEIYNGVLKHGIVDIQVQSMGETFSVFTLGLYTAGLSSFVGGPENLDDSADEYVTAGMTISLQQSYFRPLEFFNGQGELMGHVWSGSASTPTNAYTGTTLLHDHQQFIRLQNGASVTINVQGALSIDLNGQVQFSLWNRNARCQIDKNVGIAVLGSLSYDTGFMALESEFILTQEPKLQLTSDIDFASDVLLCLKLSQPSSILSHNITKIEKISATKKRRKTYFKAKYNFSGYTHALNQKNNDMCRIILGDLNN